MSESQYGDSFQGWWSIDDKILNMGGRRGGGGKGCFLSPFLCMYADVSDVCWLAAFNRSKAELVMMMMLRLVLYNHNQSCVDP